MNKISAICILLLSSVMGYAQNATTQDLIEEYQKTAGDHAALYYAPIEPFFMQARWINDPYWETDQCTSGEVLYDGVLYRDVMMRFNVATQSLIVATPVSKILVAPNMEKIEYFTLFGHRFEKFDGKFRELMSGDKNLKLWHEKTKVRGRDVEKNRRIYLNFDETDKYFIVDGGRTFQVKKAKDIAKNYPEYKKQIKKYIRTSELDYAESKVYAIVKTFEYLTSIK